MPITIVFDNDVSLLEKKAGELLQTLCATTDYPMLLLVAGGSALNVLQEVSLTRGSHITLGVVDERYSHDALHNNFLQLKNTTLYTTGIQAGITCIDTSPQERGSMEELVTVMKEAFRTWRGKHHTGKIYVVLGVGTDGHIAGIMPFPRDEEKFHELFENKEVAVVGYDAEDKNPIPLRVTATLPFLREVDGAIVYAVGDQKAEALQKVVAHEGTLFSTPARVLKQMKSVTLFTDIVI